MTFVILGLQRYGFRPLEALITALVAFIAIAYILETILARPDAGQIALHSIAPSFPAGSLFLVVSIIGATVMPHVLYLHSALTEQRIPARVERDRRRIFKMEVVDVVIAMTVAGLINGAMMFMAASVFHTHGLTGITDITTAFRTLTPLLGGAASVIFGLSLLASGLSSSTVGTMAGQVIMQGFLGWTIPIWVRRVVTMLPAIIVIILGANPTFMILLSQTVLSFALVAPIAALLYFTARKDVMGALVNRRSVTIIGAVMGSSFSSSTSSC
jgi:manganese transport protein